MCCFYDLRAWKTTLAYIIARELGVNIKITSGPAIERPGDLSGNIDKFRQ